MNGLRVKAGDLAIVGADGDPRFNGRIVEVLYLTPAQDFVLPDGFRAFGSAGEDPSWVVKLIGGPAQVELYSPRYRNQVIRTRKTWFLVVFDSRLTPLPGIADDDDVETCEATEASI